MRFSNKNVLVAGGAGFIGSNLVDQLVKEGANVIVLDNLFTGNLDNIDYLDQITFIKGSVEDEKLIDQLIGKVDIVFNLAVRNIIVSTKSPKLDFNVNAGGMFNILMAARKHNIERVVFSSSASIYGNPLYLPINEIDRTNILNPYAASKLTGENYCFAFYETYDLPISIVRYSNVYGIKQNPENPYCGVISRFINSAMEGKEIHIHGDGNQTRDFTYVEDVVEATLLAGHSPKAIGEVFNVGSGRETYINDLAELIIKTCGNHAKIVHIDRRDIDNIRRRVLNIEKIRKTLRWIPKTNLQIGIEKTYEWLSKHKDKNKHSKLSINRKTLAVAP